MTTEMTAITKERNNYNWMQSFTSFLEDEGLLKLVQHAAYHAPGLAFCIMTAPVLVPVNFVGGLLNGGDDEYDDDLDDRTNDYDDLTYMTPNHSYDNLALCDTVVYTRKDYNNNNENRAGGDETPFILKVVFNVADIILNTISPSFKIHEKSKGSYHKRKHSSRVIRANVDNENFSPIDIKSFSAITMSASTTTEYYTTVDGSTGHYFDPLSTSVSGSICDTESIYFDAEESIPSLDSSTDSQDGSTLASSTDDNLPIPFDVLTRMDEEKKDVLTTHHPKFYLNVSGIISSGVRGFYDSFLLGAEDNIVNGKYFTLRSNKSSMTNNYNDLYLNSLNCMLDELVKNSLLIASIVNGDGSDDQSWKPEDQTKKLLNRHRRYLASNDNNNSVGGTSLLMSSTAEDNTEWDNVLKSEVLKWTRSDPNSSGPMLRTQGIIDMSPTNLKELLLDCDRVSLYNKNMVEKENITTLDGIFNGEARIIRSVMKFPFVGTTMTTLSLTHARPLDNTNNNNNDSISGGYIIVSQSVGEDSSGDSNMESSNPYYSISIIQPVISNPNMTMLINVAQTSNVPLPKFLVHKVAFMSAVDFFRNLRALC